MEAEVAAAYAEPTAAARARGSEGHGAGSSAEPRGRRAHWRTPPDARAWLWRVRVRHLHATRREGTLTPPRSRRCTTAPICRERGGCHAGTPSLPTEDLGPQARSSDRRCRPGDTRRIHGGLPISSRSTDVPAVPAPPPFAASARQRAILERLARSTTAPVSRVERCRILRLTSDGWSTLNAPPGPPLEGASHRR
jgi:hypothetical protein